MKKLLIVLIVLLIAIPCFARTYTEEEFREVYDALKETNELLKESKTTIVELQEQIDALKESNNKLIEQLESSKAELENVYKLLDTAETELRNSASIIDKLNNQKVFLGVGAVLNTDFVSRIIYSAKINAGYKLWLGFVVGEIAMYNDKSFTFGVSYNIAF